MIFCKIRRLPVLLKKYLHSLRLSERLVYAFFLALYAFEIVYVITMPG